MRLAARIAKLERRVLPEGPTICPVCDLPVGSEDFPADRIVLEIPEPGGSGEGQQPDDPANDFCAGCGRRMVFRVEFDRVG
jgi:hypothetical protein